MHTLVRPAQPGDTGVLGVLEREARDGLRDVRGGAALLAEQPPVDDWGARLDDPATAVFVADLDGHVVGYLELAVRDATAEVRQVYVHPEARELGFGDDLLAAALDAGRAWGCTVIEGTALPGDRDTKNLYERAGITARKITLSRPL